MARGRITSRPLMTEFEKKQKQRVRSYRTYLENKGTNPSAIEALMDQYITDTIGRKEPIQEEVEDPTSPNPTVLILITLHDTTVGLFGPFKTSVDAMKYKSLYEKALVIGPTKLNKLIVSYPVVEMLWELDRSLSCDVPVLFPKYQ